MSVPVILALLSSLIASAYARTPLDPCRIKSRQMTLAKNCFTGDMAKGFENGPQFFGATPGSNGVNYCFNSLIQVDHKPGEALLHVQVYKDSKDGQFHAYTYTFAPDDLKKPKKEASLVVLKGLKGECFSPTGDRDACSGGLLRAIGLKDMNAPLVVGVNKAAGSLYQVNKVYSDPKEIEAHKPKEVDGFVVQDMASVTAKFLQEIKRKLTSLAHAKMAAVRSGNTSPKKMSDISEQFRYCSMAFDGFIRTQKMTDPFTPQEKDTLAALTNYMNNDPHFEEHIRAPATSTPVVREK